MVLSSLLKMPATSRAQASTADIKGNHIKSKKWALYQPYNGLSSFFENKTPCLPMQAALGPRAVTA